MRTEVVVHGGWYSSLATALIIDLLGSPRYDPPCCNPDIIYCSSTTLCVAIEVPRHR